MTPEQVLAHQPRVLTQAQRESYFANGYLLAERFIPAETVARLNAVTSEFIERSKAETRSGQTFDLAPGHGAARPMVRRLKRPDEQHPLYWEFAAGLISAPGRHDAWLGPSCLFWHDSLPNIDAHVCSCVELIWISVHVISSRASATCFGNP
jgi:hypothetical protein